MGLKLLMPETSQAPLHAAPGAIFSFGLRQLLQHLLRRPAVLGGARQEVVQIRGQRPQADLLELRRETIDRVVVVAGEFIVGLQIVRPYIDGLGLGVTAEIHGTGAGDGAFRCC